jgi:hypothetical protein
MVDYRKNNALISIHIPKTGGQGFRKILDFWFGSRLYFHYFNEKENRMPEKHDLKPGVCVHGHFNMRRQFGVMNYYPQVNQFITFLRDPFEILVSRYFYTKRLESTAMAFRDGNQLTLSDDVNYHLEKEILNPGYHPNILDYFPDKLTFQNYQKIINKKFIFIGVLEHYQDSVNKLANLLDFQEASVPEDNISERFEQVDYTLRDLFIKHHPLEYEIYSFAKSIVETQS